MIPNLEKLQERVTETLKTAKKAEEARFERHLLSTETLKDLVGEMKDDAFVKVSFYVTKGGQVIRPAQEIINPEKAKKADLVIALNEANETIDTIKVELKALKALSEGLEKENKALNEQLENDSKEKESRTSN